MENDDTRQLVGMGGYTSPIMVRHAVFGEIGRGVVDMVVWRMSFGVFFVCLCCVEEKILRVLFRI